MGVILLYSTTDLGLFTAGNARSDVIFYPIIINNLYTYPLLRFGRSWFRPREKGRKEEREEERGQEESKEGGKGKEGERRQGKEERKRKGRGYMEARRGIKGRREGRRETEERRESGEGRGGKKRRSVILLFLPFVSGDPAWTSTISKLHTYCQFAVGK